MIAFADDPGRLSEDNGQIALVGRRTWYVYLTLLSNP